MHVIRHIRFLAGRIVNLSGRHLYITRNTQSQCQETFDVVISGGGLVGCAMACALGCSDVFTGKNILLLESSKVTDIAVDQNKYSNRVCAISPGSKTLFEKFGAWKKISDIRVKEVKKMKVWESCSDANISFQYPNLKDTVAYIIENDVMLKAFNYCLKEFHSNVQVMRGQRAVAYELPSPQKYENECVIIRLNNGKELQTKLLIGADGVNSHIRQTMGVKYVTCSYNQKGIVANIKFSEPTENVVAWQRFLPSGPVALLPITDDMCSLVWTTSLPMCEKLMKMTDEEFVDALNSSLHTDNYKNTIVNSAVSLFTNALSSLLPEKSEVRQLPPSILSVECGSRAAFPLALGHATEYVVPRVALIGDAAHRVHPLAGQGVNLGFGDVQCLVDCLEQSLFRGNKLGCMDSLLDYEKQRQRHIVPSMMAIDGFKHLYGTDFMPVVLLRSLGVTFVDSSDWLKEKIMIHASS